MGPTAIWARGGIVDDRSKRGVATTLVLKRGSEPGRAGGWCGIKVAWQFFQKPIKCQSGGFYPGLSKPSSNATCYSIVYDSAPRCTRGICEHKESRLLAACEGGIEMVGPTCRSNSHGDDPSTPPPRVDISEQSEEFKQGKVMSVELLMIQINTGVATPRFFGRTEVFGCASESERLSCQISVSAMPST
jgi:hypothetical protein